MAEPVPVLVALLAGATGLGVGSFLTTVVHRVPRGLRVLGVPSACPACGRRIGARHRVPVLSWLLLRGRCRDCAAPIAVRYPLVEVGTGAAFAGTVLAVGASWVLPALLYAAALAIALTLIDVDVHRLPDALVLPAYPVTAALLALASWNPGGAPDGAALLRAGAGGATLAGTYLLLALAHPRGMGPGDVKLAGVLGTTLGWFGWGPLVIGALAAFALGGSFALALVATGRAGRRTGIAFGPWMLAGAATGIAAGGPVAGWYAGLLG